MFSIQSREQMNASLSGAFNQLVIPQFMQFALKAFVGFSICLLKSPFSLSLSLNWSQNQDLEVTSWRQVTEHQPGSPSFFFYMCVQSYRKKIAIWWGETSVRFRKGAENFYFAWDVVIAIFRGGKFFWIPKGFHRASIPTGYCGFSVVPRWIEVYHNPGYTIDFALFIAWSLVKLLT